MVDTSAIVAILNEGVEAKSFVGVVIDAEHCLLSVVASFEASMVMIGRGRVELAREIDVLVLRAAIEIVPFDEALARESRAAFVRFGKGRHPAGLNFGAGVSYALAQARGIPLLYKGDDFGKTDVISTARRRS